MCGLFSGKKDDSADKLADAVIARLAGGKGELALIADADGQVRDVYRISSVQNTMRGQSQQVKMTPCRDDAKQLLDAVKRRGEEVYYVSSRPFAFECRNPQGALVRYDGRIDPGSENFIHWLQVNAKKPGEAFTPERLASGFNGRTLPPWFAVESEEQISAPPAPAAMAAVAHGGPLVPGAAVGVYRIESELGEGGMGQVFLATDTSTTIASRQVVVLKVMHVRNASDAKELDRFIKEANTLAAMRDERIAACYSSFMYGDVPILVMEYVEGVSLDKYLESKGGKLKEAETVELLQPMAEALDYAHRNGICHLDVKPQNIIVRKTPRNGIKTCLLDFGIARQANPDGSVEHTMSVSGTRQYMSLDQLTGETPCPAMDVYSLAVTAYECISGRAPYPNGWQRNIEVEALRPDTPVTRAIMKGMSGNPEERPSTCAEIFRPGGGHSAGNSGSSAPTAAKKRRVAVMLASAAVVAGAGVATALFFGSGFPGPAQDSASAQQAAMGGLTETELLERANERLAADDLPGAAHWYRLAAECGNAQAMSMYATMLEGGGIPDANPAEAEKWYVKAARAGDLQARAVLGDRGVDWR